MMKTRKVSGRVIGIRPQKGPAQTKVCASHVCRAKFIPKRSDQIYCSKVCNTREAQRRLRERARIGA